ncbi:MAG: hypothetical protein KatS3mg132_695 [Limisphaera sp.]|nr:MAG: hypothetical protein KatS3mg132_695 [Limisphaera sp.]
MCGSFDDGRGDAPHRTWRGRSIRSIRRLFNGGGLTTRCLPVEASVNEVFPGMILDCPARVAFRGMVLCGIRAAKGQGGKLLTGQKERLQET